MIRASLRFACASFLAALSGLHAASTYTWNGTTSNDASVPANWLVDGVPATTAPGLGDTLIFGVDRRNDVFLPASSTTGALSFQGESTNPLFYKFGSASAAGLSLSGGLTTSFANVTFDSPISLALTAAQTWSVDTTDIVTVYGPIGGNAAFTKTGGGRLHLMGDASGLSGGVTVAGGSLDVGSENAFSAGTLTVKNGAALASRSGNGTSIAATVTLENGAALGDPSGQVSGRLTFTGATTLGSSAANLVLHPDSLSFFESSFNGPTIVEDVTFTGGGAAILLGTTNTANLTASGAGLVIGSPTALPSTSLQATNGGYLGMGAGFTADASAFMGKITTPATFAGTLGFDTDPRVGGGPNGFTGAIDLTAFTDPGFRGLGSATHANITGTITAPAGYKFGGGGGRLTVGSNLAGSLDLSVVSPAAAPLTLVLTGDNSGLTGSTTVQNSYLVFDSTDAAPAGAISLGASGYVSATPAASGLTATALLAKISASAETSVVGLDSSAPASTARTVPDPISLGSFAGYLGTTTFKDDGLTLTETGTITGPSTGVLKLAGLNSGKLTVSSSLLSTGSITSVVVGHPDPELGRNGTVVLSGANTYTGGTTLRRGTLILGSSATDATTGPLGAAGASGKLTINNYDGGALFSSAATLLPGLSAVTLFNDIFLEANSYLEIGRTGATGTLTLKGAMSGSGSLVFRGPTVAELLGASTRTGATRVENATVNVADNSGIQSTSLFLDNSTVAFTSTVDSPTIGSLSGTTGSILSFGKPSATLTINQTSDDKYSGTFSGTGLSLVKEGSGELWLTEPVSLGGGATVNAGTLGLAGNGTISGEVNVSSGSVAFASPNTFTTGNAYIGTNAGQTGSVEIFTGSKWSSTGYVKVGAGTSAIGSLSIEENATLQAGDVYIGYGSSSKGTIEVAGSGATLSASSLVVAKNSGAQGELRIGGGTVSISGSATINQGGQITFDSGGVFSASSVIVQGGTLEVAAGQTLAFNLGGGSGTLTFASDGAYVWQVRDKVESVQTEASLISVNGTLEVLATSSTPFHLKLATVCSGGQPGTLANFSATAPTSWTILTATSITGFDPDNFTIDTTGFLNPTDSGLFSLAQDGNALTLNFTPVPEPSTWALLITGLATLTASALRRRKRS